MIVAIRFHFTWRHCLDLDVKGAGESSYLLQEGHVVSYLAPFQ